MIHNLSMRGSRMKNRSEKAFRLLFEEKLDIHQEEKASKLSFCTAKQLQKHSSKTISSCSFIIKLANTFGEEKMSDKTFFSLCRCEGVIKALCCRYLILGKIIVQFLMFLHIKLNQWEFKSLKKFFMTGCGARRVDNVNRFEGEKELIGWKVQLVWRKVWAVKMKLEIM
jgi:hypothetical protein